MNHREEKLEIAKRIRARIDQNRTPFYMTEHCDDAERLADLVMMEVNFQPFWTELDILKMLCSYGWSESDTFFIDRDVPGLKKCMKRALDRSKAFRVTALRMRRAGFSPEDSDLKYHNDMRISNVITAKVIKLAIKFLLNKEGG